MDREGGNKEKMRKCREWISLHFLISSPILHSLSTSSSFSHSLSIFLQPGCHNLCNPDDNNILAPTWETASQILHDWLTNHLQSKCHLKVLIVFPKFLVLSFTINYLWRIIFQSIHFNSYKEDKDSCKKQPVEVIEQFQVWSALDNNKNEFLHRGQK